MQFIFLQPVLSHLLENEYDSCALLQIFQHASWEDSDRSRNIIVAVLDAIDAAEHSTYPFLLCIFAFYFLCLTPAVIAEGLLAMTDSLQALRIELLLSQFSCSSTAHGLLAIMQSHSEKFSQSSTEIAIFIMRIHESIASAAAFLAAQPREMMFLANFLEEQLK